MKKYESAKVAAKWWANKIKLPDITTEEALNKSMEEEFGKLMAIVTGDLNIDKFPDDCQLEIFTNELEARLNNKLQTEQHVFLFVEHEAKDILEYSANTAGIYTGKNGCFPAYAQMYIGKKEIQVSEDNGQYETIFFDMELPRYFGEERTKE